MEDDDEFGDLYTDVLRPFSSSLSSTPQSHQPSGAPPPLLPRPIDLNIKTEDDDDNEILYRASHDNPSAPSARVLGGEDNSSKSPIKDSIKSELVNLDEDKDVNFDVEEGNTGILEDSSPVIPGFMENDPGRNEPADVSGGGGGGWEEEEESDSEDDLQIVLNDNINHHGGTMGIEREIGDDDDDDEDGDPLVIVADGDGPNQAMEEQDWGGGEDGVAAAGGGTEGERKEGGGEVAGKGNANAIVGPKLGYSNHGYHHHPFHSQFKVSSVVAVIC